METFAANQIRSGPSVPGQDTDVFHLGSHEQSGLTGVQHVCSPDDCDPFDLCASGCQVRILGLGFHTNRLSRSLKLHGAAGVIYTCYYLEKVGTGGYLRQIFGQPDSRVHAVTEFRNNPVSGVDLM